MTIVYTVNVAGYDVIRRPHAVEDGVRYLAFTDAPKTVPWPWKAMPMPDRLDSSARRWSRVPKLRPDLYLPEHDVSIWVDANLQLRGPISQLASDAMTQAPVAAFRHPSRQCAWDEADIVAKLGLDGWPQISDVKQRLDILGFPRELALTENNFLIRSRNADHLNRKWDELYWEWPTERDQLSFMPAAWMTQTPIWFIGGHSRSNAFFQSHGHLKPRTNAL